jgi:hypothetical protein
MTGHVVNIWDLIHDPDVPSDVVQRAFGRTRARALGLPPAPIPDEDLPHLARHAQEAP